MYHALLMFNKIIYTLLTVFERSGLFTAEPSDVRRAIGTERLDWVSDLIHKTS